MAGLLHAEKDSKYVKQSKSKGKRLISEHEIKHPNDKEAMLLRASLVLDSGEILLLDKANKNIKLLGTNFDVTAVMQFKTYPFDICKSNKRKSEFYVTEPEEQSIHLIGAGQGRLTTFKKWCLYEDCRAVTCWKSGVAVTVMREGFTGTLGLLGYDCKIMKKTWESELHKRLFKAPWYMTSIRTGEHVVVSDQGNHSVICMDCKRLEVVFVFKSDILVCPRTLTRDVNDTIYVIGSSETCHNVVKLSPEGKLIGVFLNRKNKLNYPSGISYNSRENVVVLQKDRENPTIALYAV